VSYQQCDVVVDKRLVLGERQGPEMPQSVGDFPVVLDVRLRRDLHVNLPRVSSSIGTSRIVASTSVLLTFVRSRSVTWVGPSIDVYPLGVESEYSAMTSQCSTSGVLRVPATGVLRNRPARAAVPNPFQIQPRHIADPVTHSRSSPSVLQCMSDLAKRNTVVTGR